MANTNRGSGHLSTRSLRSPYVSPRAWLSEPPRALHPSVGAVALVDLIPAGRDRSIAGVLVFVRIPAMRVFPEKNEIALFARVLIATAHATADACALFT